MDKAIDCSQRWRAKSYRKECSISAYAHVVITRIYCYVKKKQVEENVLMYYCLI